MDLTIHVSNFMRKFKLLLYFALLMSIQGMAQGTVSLDSCRRMAINNNREIQAGNIKIEQAGYQHKEAAAAYLPSIDLVGGYIYNQHKVSLKKEDQYLPIKTYNSATGKYDFGLVTDPATGMPAVVDGSIVPSMVALLPKSALTADIHNIFAGAITAVQPIYMGGKIRAMNAITKYAEELARSMNDSKIEDVIYSVDQAYWQVVSLRAKEKLVHSYLKLVKNLDSDVEKMMKQGVATQANKLSVDVKVNEGNVNLTKVENGLALSRMLLNQLCGQPIDRRYTLADEDKEDIEGTLRPSRFNMDTVYSKRHEIESLTLATKIYDEKANVTKSEMMPQVAAFAAYHALNPNSYNGFENKFGFGFSVGAMVKVPLWHWGGLSNKYKAALADARIKRVELEDAKEKIALQVNQAAYRYQEAWKTYEKTKANLVSANENLRCATVGYKEGVMNLDEVLTAQTAWFKAYSDNIDAQIDIQLCDVYLSKVLGEMRY